jgi:MFS transporter, DHA1 family, inner membrane transport protein
VIIVLAVFTVTVHHAVLAIPTVFLLGAIGKAAVPALQTRLMDVAADAQSLAAALTHSALNVANALGAWLGGLVVSAGYGYPSTAWAGVALAGGGLVVAVTSGRADRRAVPRGRVAASPASIRTKEEPMQGKNLLVVGGASGIPDSERAQHPRQRTAP